MHAHTFFCSTRQLLLRCMVILLCASGSTRNYDVQAQNAVSPIGASKAPKQAPVEGRQMFESACAGCHGLDGRGGERGPDIATRQQVVQLTDAGIMEILRGGRPA